MHISIQIASAVASVLINTDPPQYTHHIQYHTIKTNRFCQKVAMHEIEIIIIDTIGKYFLEVFIASYLHAYLKDDS